ncbi:MAG TPA: zinc ribbon domain-containing protein [Epulopiscium sp.]|nr:zinc ribbon domain-containing protein [Candidatus Epulonipiscium sp.]
MALISCPECSKEISDRVKSCPHCGYPLIEENTNAQKVELTSVSMKLEKGKKKKIIKATVSLVMILVVVFGSVFLYNKQKAEKLAIAYAETLAVYGTNIELLMSEIISSGAEAEGLINLTYKVWYNTIYKKSDPETDKYTKKDDTREKDFGDWETDFNKSLVRLFRNLDTKEKIENINLSEDRIEEIMRELKNPPVEYNRSYEILLELYSAYQGISDLAINPSGNLQSFGEDKKEKIGKFVELYNKLETQLPEY